MGKRFTWNHHSQRGNRHAQWRLPEAAPDAQPPLPGFVHFDYWRRSRSVRHIRCITHSTVTYVLYKRRKTNKGFKWVELRWIDCKHKAWLKWAKGAVRIHPLLKTEVKR